MEVQTAGGIIQVPLSHAHIQLGKSKMDNVVVGVIPDPKQMDADGIIGMNFLEHFRMEVDKGSQKISLTR
jgi:hypothetical protein